MIKTEEEYLQEVAKRKDPLEVFKKGRTYEVFKELIIHQDLGLYSTPRQIASLANISSAECKDALQWLVEVDLVEALKEPHKQTRYRATKYMHTNLLNAARAVYRARGAVTKDEL